MKIKHLLLNLAMTLSAFAVLAQEVENDDLYFNSKDRAKLKAKEASEVTYTASSKETTKNRDTKKEEEVVNPTDSYSARTINPEFAARSNAEVAKEDEQDYYVSDYRYKTSSDLNNFNNNFNSWYGNPWYTSSWYGPSINNWNSPYYGYYDPYNSPWYDPYWNYNGWSASFSYYWGNSWNYGWGGNYNYWNRPYCGSAWASSWGMSYGWGPGYYGYGYGYPTVIVVNNGEGRYPNYGKRNSRSSNGGYVQSQSSSGRPSYPGSTSYGSRSNTSNSSGRVSTRPSSSSPSAPSTDEYYNRSWRRVTQQSTNTPSGSGSSNSSGRTSSGNSGSWYGNTSGSGNSNSSGVDRSSGGSRSSTYTPSSSGSSSGGSRSSGSSSGSSGGSSGGSRSRSRGN